jgi:hypothetical protein
MPPLPLPHTATQLEEARRRLLEEEGRTKAVRQRYSFLLTHVFVKCAVCDGSIEILPVVFKIKTETILFI